MSDLIKVEFQIVIPEKATDEQIQEWLEFTLSAGSISLENPFINHGLEAESFSVIFDRY